MKKSMSRLIALALVLVLMLGASALATDITSAPFRLPGAKLRPTQQPESDASQNSEPDATQEPGDSTAPQNPVTLPVKVVANCEMVNVRAEASASSEILTTAKIGDEVGFIAEEGNWSLVRLADGTEGYISSKYLSDPAPLEPEPTVEPTVEPTAEPTVEPTVESTENSSDEPSTEPTEIVNPSPEPTEVAGESDPTGEFDQPIVSDEPVPDEDGNPIPEPSDEAITSELVDEVAPYRNVEISMQWLDAQAGSHNYGDEAVLTAKLTGYENLEYVIQWQSSKTDNEEDYVDVPGAVGARYVVPVTEDNINDYWRVVITITGVAEEAE